MDKAGKQYWDNLWLVNKPVKPVDPRLLTLKNYVRRSFHKYFSKVFQGLETRGMKLLEIGCANSPWLPYFAKEFGLEVYGLDYSEIGCQIERQILSDAGIKGEVVYVDLFSPPEHMIGLFDVVVSFGVVEHFEDTSTCISAMEKFIKPGGILITSIPNMVGLVGLIQKVINRPSYNIHQQIDVDLLVKAHENADCQVEECDYFLSVNFGICHLNGLSPHTFSWGIKKIFLLLLRLLSAFIWAIEDMTRPFAVNKWTSPYINCIAKRVR